MFDIRWIHENPQAFDAGLSKRGLVRGGEIKFAAELIALVRRCLSSDPDDRPPNADEERRDWLTELASVEPEAVP